MAQSNENNPGLVRPTQFQDQMNERKHVPVTRQRRRALSVINQNLVGAQPYPCIVKKRDLSQKQVIYDKNQPDPVNRPITRRFAAQIASTQKSFPQHKVQEPTNPKKSVSNSSSGWEDCIYIDTEDEEDNADADHAVPMSLEETEAAMDEADHMEEVEMEDIMEPIVDIDGRDVRNPLAVVEYVNDIYAYYRKVEGGSCVSPNYMVQQRDINEKMRGILIDWLIEVHDKFELLNESLFLTVNIIDRFLAKQTVARKKLQLVGLVAMLLACKYEEVSVPIVDDLILISDKAYSRKDVLDMERLMLNTLQFNMSLPTPYVFMQRFLKASESDKKLEILSFFMIELCLVEYEMLKFPPSCLAAAAIYTAQCTLYGFKQWNRTCEWYTNYSEDQLLECSRLIVTLHQKAETGKLTAVHRKYCTSKYGYAAKSEPAQILKETQL